MTTENLIAVVVGTLVIVMYGLYSLYFSRNNLHDRKINLEKKINKLLDSTQEKQNVEGISLLKAEPDTYFKSKLPKIEGFNEWIQHTGLDIKPTIVLLISILIGLFFIFLFIFYFHINILISFLLGIILSFFVPWCVITYLTSRRKKDFLEEFPVALDIMRRALRAGHSIDRAIGMVVLEVKGPVGIAFKQMVDQFNLGIPFETVLADMSNRIGIDDFRMLAIVIVLQRETGGSLAEAIDNFSKIIRVRQQLRKKVKALTGEVRVTAAILSSIPFFIFGAVYFLTPQYFDPLFNTDNGHIVAMVGAFMLFTGIGIIVRMTYKENY